MPTGFSRHISSDHPEIEMTAKKWNYLITMTAGFKILFPALQWQQKMASHVNISQIFF